MHLHNARKDFVLVPLAVSAQRGMVIAKKCVSEPGSIVKPAPSSSVLLNSTEN